jgi:tRNA-specific 2-thiouridylase
MNIQPSSQETASRHVVVAMSGGVDSSVAAALLVQQGYQVTGLMLRLWSESGRQDDNRCCTPDAMAQARRVAAMLGIPFYAIDAQEAFYQSVVQHFIQDYAQGLTPNPCLVCNRRIRWGFLLQHAQALGAGLLATGHYVRLRQDQQGRYEIWRAVDAHKDQSYVLHILSQQQLKHASFPLGEYTKPQVRQIARQLGLPVAERADSQDLCFLGGEDYRSFLLRHAPQVENPGPILNRQGQPLGEHRGLAFYTIGQRKGLGVASSRPLYVLSKDLQRNALIVGEESELGQSELTASEVHWVSGDPPAAPFRARVKVRYTAIPAWGTVTPQGERQAQVRFDQPVRDITPGQAAVFYIDEICTGGGIIQP